MWLSCGQQGCCPWFIHTALLGPVRRTRPHVHWLSSQFVFSYRTVPLACCCLRFASAYTPIYAPVFSFVWLASSADARQSPIRIKAAGLPQGKCSCAPGSFRAPENYRCQTLSNGSDATRISGSPLKRTRPFMVQGLGVSVCTCRVQNGFMIGCVACQSGLLVSSQPLYRFSHATLTSCK